MREILEFGADFEGEKLIRLKVRERLNRISWKRNEVSSKEWLSS